MFAGLREALKDHPHAGDIRGGKGLLAAVELVEDKATKKNFPVDKKVAPRLQAEMMKRDVVRTRVRPTSVRIPPTATPSYLLAAAGGDREAGGPAGVGHSATR